MRTHRVIRRRHWVDVPAWLAHRAEVHRRMAVLLDEQATTWSEQNTTEAKARRKARRLAAQLAALREQFGAEVGQFR